MAFSFSTFHLDFLFQFKWDGNSMEYFYLYFFPSPVYVQAMSVCIRASK